MIAGSNAEDGTRREVEWTRRIVTAMVLLVLPLAFVTLRSSFVFLFPWCDDTIERAVDFNRAELRSLEAVEVPLADGRPREGDLRGAGFYAESYALGLGPRIVRIGMDERGRTCACGDLDIDSSLREGNPSGRLRRTPAGVYYFEDWRFGPVDPGFRLVHRRARYGQGYRILSRHHLPAVAALLGSSP